MAATLAEVQAEKATLKEAINRALEYGERISSASSSREYNLDRLYKRLNQLEVLEIRLSGNGAKPISMPDICRTERRIL